MIEKKLKLEKETIIPTINKGFCNVGFLFGAGTSFEAGYPLMSGLTTIIFSKLDDNDKGIIETALKFHNKANQTNFNIENNIPDIELLLNIIKDLQTGKSGYFSVIYKLEQKIKQLIFGTLKNINPSNLNNHIKFLNYVKKKIGTNHVPMWIFTTNYDLLIELASSAVNLYLENGFCGTIKRFFDLDCYKRVHGYLKLEKQNSYNFEPHKNLQLKLCKLHGSLSWFKNNDIVSEFFNETIKSPGDSEVMIYPERNKIDETLSHPYDKLFTYANDILGKDVKYLVSCGYSFRDQHINDRLLIPRLKNGSLRIFALFESEPDGIDELKQYSAFNYLTKDKLYLNGNLSDFSNNLWKFSEFVKFVTE
ncbi:MAG: hypothetical protein BHW64_00550 [Candidatus Melainabacteria bacterium LEY3_CP_29_8]|nr:MAG: hypothetical protein BHW64_00550 [Candidatus Melainabacteria bacterium LEY3_CP_29_8]